MKTSFIEFNHICCLKINLMSTFAFIIMFGLSFFFMKDMSSQSLQALDSLEVDNGLGALMFILILGFIVGFIWVVFSLAIPAFIPLFIRFSDNIKSIVGLLLCNVGTTAFLYLNFTLQLAICYAVPVFLGIFFTLYWRYVKIRKIVVT